MVKLSLFLFFICCAILAVDCSKADKNTLYGRYCVVDEDNSADSGSKQPQQGHIRAYEDFRSQPPISSNSGSKLQLPSRNSKSGYDLPKSFVPPSANNISKDASKNNKSQHSSVKENKRSGVNKEKSKTGAAQSTWDYLK